MSDSGLTKKYGLQTAIGDWRLAIGDRILTNFKHSLFKHSSFTVLFISLCLSGYGQLLTPLSNEENRRIEQMMSLKEYMQFTVLKPFYDSELTGGARQDSLSLFPASSLPHKTWLSRKLFHESLLQVDSNQYYLFADPIFDFGIGKENTGRKTWVNTRGFRIGARLGRYFAFGSDFYENQAVFYTALDAKIRQTKVVPGQGRGRVKGNTWDYSHSSGYLSFTPLQKLNIQLGTGQSFTGDGYRSLLLSDAAFNYPYLRVTWQSKVFMYSWMMGSIQDLNISNGNDQFPFGRRTISEHLLSVNLLKRVQFSIIKCGIYDNPDTTGHMKTDIGMFNPVIMPSVSRVKSHSLWGANVKIKVTGQIWFYNQCLFDRLFEKGPLRTGIQVGLKYFDLLGIKGLYLQTEYNRLNAYAYSSSEKILDWVHYQEPLAHPYGNNFQELIALVSYSWRRWQLSSHTNYANQLKNISDENSYKAAGVPYFTNGQKLLWQNFQMSWFMNPKNMVNFAIGYTYRKEALPGVTSASNYVYFAFRTSLINLYEEY
jgi:hypothetical protein